MILGPRAALHPLQLMCITLPSYQAIPHIRKQWEVWRFRERILDIGQVARTSLHYRVLKDPKVMSYLLWWDMPLWVTWRICWTRRMTAETASQIITRNYGHSRWLNSLNRQKHPKFIWDEAKYDLHIFLQGRKKKGRKTKVNGEVDIRHALYVSWDFATLVRRKPFKHGLWPT